MGTSVNIENSKMPQDMDNKIMNLTRGQAPCEMARVCLDSLSVRRVRTASPTPSDCESDAFGLRSLRYAAILLLMMFLGMNTVWGQTYYVFKYDGHYVAHNGYTTDGTEICVENEFSITKCLWEYTAGTGHENQKYLRTFGADYWLYYLSNTNNPDHYVHTLALKSTAPQGGTTQDGWNRANTTDGIRRYLRATSAESWPAHYVCYNETGTPYWELVTTDVNTKKALGTELTKTETAYKNISSSIGGGSDVISAIGSYTYNVDATTVNSLSYVSFTDGETTRYWYGDSEHDVAPEDWGDVTLASLTKEWSLTPNDYATVDSGTGVITVTSMPTEDVQLTLTCTLSYSTFSKVVTKDITIGAAMQITITMNDWEYGNNPTSPKTTITPKAAEKATKHYYYKLKSDSDDKYGNKPTKTSKAGLYTVKVVVDQYGNYSGGEATADFNITKAPLTITADAKEKDYLDDDPKLTYTVTGIKNEEKEVNVITCVLQRATGEAKGEYAITRKSHNVKSNNYSFDTNTGFVGATFTINPKTLGDGDTPAPGISIYAKDNGDNTLSVSVYNGKKALRYNNTDLSKTDYTYVVDGNIITITAQGDNCTSSAKATYSSDVTFYAINGTTEKFTPYISTTSDLMTSAEEDLVPYIVSYINPTIGTISIVPISYIPKDEPVLLLAPSDVTGITTSTKNPATPAISESLISNNKLMIAPEGGVDVNTTEAYIFYKGEFVLTTAGTIKAGKYYLYNPNYHQGPSTDPTPAPALYLSIVKDETTGVIQLTSDEVIEGENEMWYTIDGQKFNKKPTRKGIYIQNGKKLIVK